MFCLKRIRINPEKNVPFHFLGSNKRYLAYPETKTKVALEKKIDITRAICEAEKIVGYPTSFLNLRWLLSDEVANIALHLRKLIGSGHPLIHAARNLLTGQSSPAWGLVVLLLAKVGGLNGDFKEIDKDASVGVLHSQRALAEVTEMIRTSNIIHKSLVNINRDEEKSFADASDLYFGNKISLLSGDYLLSSSYHTLACLKHQSLNELMCTALRDLVEAEFLDPRDEQNVPLPAKPNPTADNIEIPYHYNSEPYETDKMLGNAEAEWTLRNILGGASLLGKSCQGTLKLAGHPPEVQERAYRIGRNVALTLQARKDLELFSNSDGGSFCLICAPLLFHLEYEPSLYSEIEKGKSSVGDIDFELLRKSVRNGPGLNKTYDLIKKHASIAIRELGKFPESKAKKALTNIVMASP